MANVNDSNKVDTIEISDDECPPKLPPKPAILFRPSILTQKAEALRTDKTSINNSIADKPKFSISNNDNLLSKINDSNDNKSAKDVCSGFVFGESILARTTGVSDFAALAEKDSKKSDGESFEDENNVESLRKNAEEVQKQHSHQPQLEEAEVITGEENEKNVLRMSCKLYQFNSDKNDWIGKGPCNIRLNDNKSIDNIPARLVIRSKGGLQVIVNTFVWSDMFLEKNGTKSIRFSAQSASDSSKTGVKIFLAVLMNVADADLFYEMLSERKDHLAESKNNSNAFNEFDVSTDIRRKRPASNNEDSEEKVNNKVAKCDDQNEKDDDPSKSDDDTDKNDNSK